MKEKEFLDLPPEIVLVILEKLSDKDVLHLGLSCRQLYAITSSFIEIGKTSLFYGIIKDIKSILLQICISIAS